MTVSAAHATDSRSSDRSLTSTQNSNGSHARSRERSGSLHVHGRPGRRERYLSEREYVDRIYDHARKKPYQALYSGNNFYKLYTFLSLSLAASKDSADCQDQPLFATLYLLHEHQSISKDFPSEDIKNAKHLTQAEEALRGKTTGPANELLFLRGFPTPEWLCRIGSYYTVDPEFYRRHLDLSLFPHQTWFSSPSLPSTSYNFLRLRITTLVRRTPDYLNLKTARSEARERMAAYIGSMSEPNYSGVIGESIVRRFSVHSKKYCSIEQDISLCCCRSNQGWTVIAWLDSGKDLDKCERKPNGPWVSEKAADPIAIPDFSKFEPIPLVRNEPRSAIHKSESDERSKELLRRSETFQKSRSLLTLDYGRQFEELDIHNDAFYAVIPIYKFKAAAESQFLNLIDALLHNNIEDIRFTKASSDGLGRDDYLVDLESSHDDFSYNKEILEHHVHEIRENIRAIKAHGSTQWPASDHPKVKEAVRVLLEDFDWLHERARALSALCDRALTDIHEKSALAESFKANEQADRVNKLTRLATFMSVFYIPLSYTSGFFGMNFSVFGQGSVPLWLYPVVSAPILVCSFMFMYWNDIRRELKNLTSRSVPETEFKIVNRWEFTA